MTTELLDRLIPLTLSHGTHGSPDAGMCAMEAVAYVTGEPFSDHPQCVSPVIAAALRTWNDGLPDNATRNTLLKPLLVLCVGTNTTDDDERIRAAMAADWLVRVQAPAWLRLAGLTDEAAALETLAVIVDTASLVAAQPALNAARKQAAARAAAWAAARDAAEGETTYDGARAKADAAMASTRAQLQGSFAHVVAAMCRVGRAA